MLKMVLFCFNIILFSDDLINPKVKPKRAKKKTVVAEERERLKNVDTQYDFDINDYELKRKTKPSISNTITKAFSNKKAKNGVSLIDQYRQTLKEKEINEESIVDDSHEQNASELEQIAEKTKLKERQLLQAIKCKGSLVKQRRERQDVRAVFCKKPVSKKDDNTIFTESDFETNARGTY